MRPADHSSEQVQTVFGGAFVSEHHAEPSEGTLGFEGADGVNKAVGQMATAMLASILKSLRAALSLR
jgi:hypothetical protein